MNKRGAQKIGVFNPEELAGLDERVLQAFEQLIGMMRSLFAPLIADKGLTISAGPFLLADDAVLRPVTIAANKDDYNPPGLSRAVVVEISSDAARNITGLVPFKFDNGSRPVRLLCLTNIGSSTITLVHNGTASSSYARMMLPNAANLGLATNEGVWLIYDRIANNWRSLDYA